MVRFYILRIRNGYMTLDQVPPRWHDAVKARMIELGLLEGEE